MLLYTYILSINNNLFTVKSLLIEGHISIKIVIFQANKTKNDKMNLYYKKPYFIMVIK